MNIEYDNSVIYKKSNNVKKRKYKANKAPIFTDTVNKELKSQINISDKDKRRLKVSKQLKRLRKAGLIGVGAVGLGSYLYMKSKNKNKR
jgi:hypothetical protein